MGQPGTISRQVIEGAHLTGICVSRRQVGSRGSYWMGSYGKQPRDLYWEEQITDGSMAQEGGRHV